ncbi:MAG TPA: MarR family transcriptional regulator [Candidatus Paceibacterota bacterium]|nr:MarR family transcriptional regulator [Candidatus Paceibacterota bacterium]
MRKKIIREILMTLSFIRKRVVNKVTEQMLRNKVSPLQLMILDFLTQQKGASVKDIASNFNISMASVSDPVEDLVKGGYLKRKSDLKDRRITRLFIQLKGMKIVKKTMDAVVLEMFNGLSEKDLKNYLNVVKKVCESMGKNAKIR